MSSFPSNTSRHFVEDASDRCVVANVELGHERASDRLGELADALLNVLALEGERHLRAAVGKLARDRPRDRALVCDTENQSPFSLEHETRCYPGSATLRGLAPPSDPDRGDRAGCGHLGIGEADAGSQAEQRVGSPAARPRRKIVIPAGHTRGVTRVIVRLAAPPLAVWNSERTLTSTRSTQHLNVHSVASRAYVAQLQRAQDVAVAEVREAIPQAQIQERYSVLLDGFTVQSPERSLAKLVKLKGVTKVYPSLAYFTTSSPGPSVIRATDLSSATGDQGQGMKIAVVDTGVDIPTVSSNPPGFSYPPGFPRGDTKMTTPKVIVAKVFPGPVRDKNSNKAFDVTEPHGTHVSGIAAGDEGTTAPAGPDHPEVTGLTGVAPKAWIGNYRVFTIPTPLGHEADTPEIVEAFEAAVTDGMNVINFSGGGPQTDPANDAMFETIHNVSLAGVIPVVAAGNDRDDFGLGTVGSPAAAPDAIAVAATSTGEVFSAGLSVIGGLPRSGTSRSRTRAARSSRAPGRRSTRPWSTCRR